MSRRTKYPKGMKYIKRSDWGALDSGKPLKPFRRKIQGIVVHHTTGPSHSPWDRVRGHDKYHVKTKGWDSIAYNWLVSGETGEIFEGRGWMKGAATYGWNSKTISVSYIGDSEKQLSDIGKETILAVVGAIREKHGNHLWVKCHKDFSSTTCPGKPLAEWVHKGMPTEDVASNTALDWDAIRQYVIDLGNKYLNTRILKRGAKGQLVELAQKRLNDLTNANLKVDGIFGRKTGDAITQFKSNYAMKVNRIIDKNTWKVMWTI